MGETTREIEARIEATRHDLGANLDELGDRLHALADWRRPIRARPWLALGAAAAVGGLAGWARRPRPRSASSVVSSDAGAMRATMSRHVRPAVEAMDDIAAALVGVAVARLTDYAGEIVPGLREHLPQRPVAGRARSAT